MEFVIYGAPVYCKECGLALESVQVPGAKTKLLQHPSLTEAFIARGMPIPCVHSGKLFTLPAMELNEVQISISPASQSTESPRAD